MIDPAVIILANWITESWMSEVAIGLGLIGLALWFPTVIGLGFSADIGILLFILPFEFN